MLLQTTDVLEDLDLAQDQDMDPMLEDFDVEVMITVLYTAPVTLSTYSIS